MAFERISAADTDAERAARLRLARSARVGPVNFANLLGRYGSALRALDELPNMVRRSGGNFVAAPEIKVEEELRRARRIGARLVLLGDTDYPSLLARVDAAPPVLWTLGPLKLHGRTIAIVGARNASAAGQTMATALARELGRNGFHIISGLARGIDARAHEAALTAGTAAVLGGGVDDVYPPENAALYGQMREHGLLISESPVGYTAQARDFPRRNRIISGLSLGTIVVEAELRSGSLITARLAAEQNREVFAVPGSPLDPRCRGCNDLLRQGANLCETADDVVRILESQMGFSAPEALAPVPPPSATSRNDDDDIGRLNTRVMELVGATPVSRDVLLRLAGAPAHLTLSAISELHIAGRIDEVDGGYIRAV